MKIRIYLNSAALRRNSTIKTTILSNLYRASLDNCSQKAENIYLLQNRIADITTTSKSRFALDMNEVNCHGAYILPGFKDSHIHLAAYCQSRSIIHLDQMSLDQIRLTLSQSVQHMHSGDWIRGRGWEMNLWNDDPQATTGFLDSICPDNPVALISKDGHSIWLNKLAMHLISLPFDQPDPPGGRFDRDSITGQLTGFMRENAAELVIKKLPRSTDSEILDTFHSGIQTLHELGIVSIDSFETITNLKLLIHHFSKNLSEFKIRVYVEPQEFEETERLFKDEQVSSNISFGGIKMFADGALGSRTAAVMQAYSGEPENYGIQVTSSQEMIEHGLLAARRNRGIAVHAIGDRALSNTLDAFESIRSMFPHTPLRIEHIQLAQPEDLMRMHKLNVLASVQPTHMISDRTMATRLWKEQSGLLYPYGSIERTGIGLCFGSDAPIERPSPLESIMAATHRRPVSELSEDTAWVPEETMSLSGAIRSSIIPEIRRQEALSFMLQPGDFANAVVWDTNPIKYLMHGGKRPVVLLAINDGQILFDRLTSNHR